MGVLVGMLVFILGGLLFAAGVIGLVAVTLSSPVMQLWGRLGELSISQWPAILLGIVFLILFLAGVYLMKSGLSRHQN
jgi:hypothetical protein